MDDDRVRGDVGLWVLWVGAEFRRTPRSNIADVHYQKGHLYVFRGRVKNSIATLLLLCLAVGTTAKAFQIGPAGSSFESKLTNESESNLGVVARHLGLLIKSPVHEEITQLAFGCPANTEQLYRDDSCGSADRPFASAFVIYGVRWNDVPPFKLASGQGNCTVLGKNSCNTDQTIRFSTQPSCWTCLFKDAEKIAQKKRIAGCTLQAGETHGNVMTRSHFGDLQFLHGMADAEGIEPTRTHQDVMDWMEFAWKVSSREIRSDTLLNSIQIDAIKAHFGCTQWTVADLYILGRTDKKSGLLPHLGHIAFGSVLHTVQDSFAAGHTEREGTNTRTECGSTGFLSPPRILEFHNYGAQDGKLHDHQDSRSALVTGAPADDWPTAVEVTRNLFSLRENGTKWEGAKEYISCVFELTQTPRRSSPGVAFARVKSQR